MLRLISLRMLESYFRHRWLYLLPFVLMILSAVLFFSFAKPKYISRGVLFVKKESLLAELTSVRGTSFTWQTPASLTVGEINELLQTDSFIRAVISDTDLEARMDGGTDLVNQTIAEVRAAVWVSSIGDNQLRVSAAHENSLFAFQLVNGTINSFMDWKINADRNESVTARNFFTDLIGNYSAEVEGARQNLYDYYEAHPSPIKGDRPIVEQLEITRLQSQLELASSRYASALDKDENARLAAAQAEGDILQSYTVVDSPIVATAPEVSLKQMAMEGAVFVLAGILLSLLAIAGGALLDRSLRFPIDVWHGLHLPVLASVPDVARLQSKKKPKWYRRRKSDSLKADDTETIEDDIITSGDAVGLPSQPEWQPNSDVAASKTRRGKKVKEVGIAVSTQDASTSAVGSVNYSDHSQDAGATQQEAGRKTRGIKKSNNLVEGESIPINSPEAIELDSHK
jgi:capsular polysaccharide biosynthesis protein